MALSLVLLVQLLPFALERGNQLLTFLLGHQHLLPVLLVLLFNLHLLHQVVLVLDLVLDLGQVTRGPAVSLLIQEVLVLVCGQLRS